MSKKVTVVDYGVGNLKSVTRALEAAGAEVELTQEPSKILAAERLLLPGVGAFGSCMQELKARGLAEPVHRFAESQRPFLGICVGMQIMLSLGEEFGQHAGLGLIEGTVSAIPAQGADGQPQRLPYIGWAELAPSPDASRWQNTVLEGVKEKSSVYFLHSFAAHVANAEDELAHYDYNGLNIPAAIQRGNLTGLQFHPEKSGSMGLQILKQFLQL